jgi:hypothetical protein
MTFERFQDYVKTMAGSAMMAYLVLAIIVDGLLGYVGMSKHPWPITLPICASAALWGWWLVYKSPEIPYRHCPTCGSWVTVDTVKDATEV